MRAMGETLPLARARGRRADGPAAAVWHGMCLASAWIPATGSLLPPAGSGGGGMSDRFVRVSLGVFALVGILLLAPVRATAQA